MPERESEPATASAPVSTTGLLMRQANDAIFIADFSARLIDVNPRACALLGYQREELLAFRIPDLFRPEDLTSDPIDFAAVREGRALVRLRPLRRKDGTTVSVEVSAQVLEDGRYLAVVRDATERHRAEEAVRRSEASFRSLIEHLPDAVVVHRNGRILYFNPAAQRLLGYTERELEGLRAIELIHPDEREGLSDRIAVLQSPGAKTPPREERLCRSDGTYVATEVAALTLMFDGAPAIVAVIHDLTERNRMQAQLIHADRLANIGVIAAGVAHEINNPLTYMLIGLERVGRELAEVEDALGRVRAEVASALGEAEAAALFDRARATGAADLTRSLAERAGEVLDGARRVGKIARDLKTFAHTGEGSEPRGADVHAILDRAVDVAANELRFRAKVVRAYGAVPPVQANAGRLTQVFLNLLVNAAHAIEPGDPEDNAVTLVTSTDEREVTIAIVDTGHGIAPEHLGRLFEPFFTTKAAGEGSGLGLSICQNIVRAEGGRIEVASELGKGSRFSVILPIFVAQPASPRAPTAPPPGEAPAPRARVLVIDDERTLGRALAALLGDHYDVALAESGAQAVQLLDADPAFDVILCDLMMPGLSGAEVHAHLERTAPALATRVIFMTGGAFSADGRALIERLPGRSIEKPFELAELLRVIARVAKSA